MFSFARRFQAGVGSLPLIATALPIGSVRADDGFPFGTEMQLDVNRQPGSKRIPNLEIGDAGEVVLELWCKGGKAGSGGGQHRDLRRRRDAKPALSAGPGSGR